MKPLPPLFSPGRLFSSALLALALPLMALTSVARASATPERVNYAKFQRATASVSNGNYAPDFAVDGIVSNFHSYRTGSQTAPYWLEIAYPRPVAIASAHLYLGILDGASPLQVPANFRFQYHDGSVWRDIPGSGVSANTAAEVNVVFTQPVTATRFRYYGTDNSNRTIREIALFPPNLVGGVEQGHPLGTDVRLNLAHRRPSAASSAALNNIYGAGYAQNAFDGYVDNASRWVAAAAASGEYIEVDLLASHRVGAAHVYSGFIDPADPTRTTTQPLPNFTLQYWDGAAWLPIPGAEITANTQVARAIEFTTPVTTTRVRLVTTSAFNGRVQELLLFPPRTGGTPLGREVVQAPPPARGWDFYSDNTYRLRNRGPDLRLGLLDGVAVQIPAPAGDTGPVDWQLLLNHRDGSYRVRHIASGLGLALGEISKADNTPVVAEPYTGLPHQDWRLDYDPAVPSRFRLVNLYSGLALQPLNTSWLSGAPLVVRPAVDGLLNQYWDANYIRHHPKKGIAATGNVIATSSTPYTTEPGLTFLQDFYNRLNGSWSYGWGRQTSDAHPFIADSINHAYNPMQWGNFNWLHTNPAGPLERIYRDVQANAKPVHLMAFNEPDKESQGFITVADAILRWPRLQAVEAPLVSPVPASTFNGWQADFVAQANALGYRRDYTAVHWYASPNADSLIAHLQQAYNDFGRPVWLTEFSTVNWSGTSTWTDADNFNFLAEFLWRAESLPWIKRYSVFAFIKGPTDNPNQSAPDTPQAPRSNTIDIDGSLTPFGQLYAGWDGVTAVVNNRAYHLHNHGNYARLRNPGGTGSPGLASPAAPDPGVQFFLSPGATANTFRIISTRDGRPLRFVDGANVSYGAPGASNGSVEWRAVADQHGRYFIEHPATNKRLRMNSTGSFSMVEVTNTGDNLKWRFVGPAVPDPAGPPAAPSALVATPASAEISLSWSAVDRATGYTVSRATSASGPWTALASGLTSATYADTSVAAGTEYFYQVTATNLYALESAPSAVVSAALPEPPPPPATFAGWSETTLAALPPAERLPAADPDGDGLPNLLEYALDLDPLAPGASAGPAGGLTPAGTHMRLTFLRARPELTYEVLASSDLVNWTVIASNPGAVSETEPVTVTDPVAVSENPRRFLRLRVVVP